MFRRTRVGLALATAFGAVAVMVPATPAAAQGPAAPYVRGVYGRDSSPGGVSLIKGAGFDTVTVQPWKDHLDQLSGAGMKGVVWLWGYDNATCSFAADDAMVRDVVRAIAGHPAIVAYQVADEPNYATVENGCRNVPAQMKARSDLIKSVDPTKPTYVVIPVWDGREMFPYQDYTEATDIMGIDVYPCAVTAGNCDMSLIDKAIAAAHADGVRRYWGVLQDFADGYYTNQSAAQIDEQFTRWAKSRMEGYFVYHWNYGEIESKPDHIATYARRNATLGHSVTSPAPSPSPTPVPLPGGGENVVPGGSPTVPTADTQAPTAPTSLYAAPTRTGTDLWWSASSDDRAVAGYVVWRDGRRLGQTDERSFTDDGARRRSHTYAVKAVDAAGNLSPAATIAVTTWRKGDLRLRVCALWTMRRLIGC